MNGLSEIWILESRCPAQAWEQPPTGWFVMAKAETRQAIEKKFAKARAEDSCTQFRIRKSYGGTRTGRLS